MFILSLIVCLDKKLEYFGALIFLICKMSTVLTPDLDYYQKDRCL